MFRADLCPTWGSNVLKSLKDGGSALRLEAVILKPPYEIGILIDGLYQDDQNTINENRRNSCGDTEFPPTASNVYRRHLR
ncbi:hypothetical protein RRG08_009522 [Elysia crispata]|uniref:Uncharacterized protein n=1 Tax=Elysia crispata TaxID=231223 RepID=A0AAE1B203_9GAST|nr:hypothetical protein RRG08_009522 [Elysia crispata]